MSGKQDFIKNADNAGLKNVQIVTPQKVDISYQVHFQALYRSGHFCYISQS